MPEIIPVKIVIVNIPNNRLLFLEMFKFSCFATKVLKLGNTMETNKIAIIKAKIAKRKLKGLAH